MRALISTATTAAGMPRVLLVAAAARACSWEARTWITRRTPSCHTPSQGGDDPLVSATLVDCGNSLPPQDAAIATSKNLGLVCCPVGRTPWMAFPRTVRPGRPQSPDHARSSGVAQFHCDRRSGGCGRSRAGGARLRGNQAMSPAFRPTSIRSHRWLRTRSRAVNLLLPSRP